MTDVEIFSLIQSKGYTYNHAAAVAISIYRKRIKDISQIKGIPKALMTYLDHVTGMGTGTGLYSPTASEISVDGTTKYLFISV